jgi:tRNA(Ile)-lysidine synthase
LLERLKKILKEFGIKDDTRFLLALSGGIDSMVLCDLLLKNKSDFTIAHCNFELRGDESNGDEKFVLQHAKTNGIPIYVEKFDTSAFAKTHRISIQEAARELRYSLFQKIAEKEKIDYILTAHNLDDRIETFFINFLRGAGLKGLASIPEKNGNIIRPILSVSREEIEIYATEEKLVYREDSSNKETKYLRNQFRHLILPKFKNLDKDYQSSFSKSIDYLNQAKAFYKESLQNKFSSLIKKENASVCINTNLLLKEKNAKIILFEMVSKYHFNDTQSNDVFRLISLSSIESGKKFFSSTHRLIIDRDEIIIKEKAITEGEFIINNLVPSFIFNKKKIEFKETTSAIEFKNIPNNNIYVDADKITFPLIVRKWKNGDRFYPYGMNGSKLISDYFIDEKFSLFQKEEVYLLCNSDNSIIWIIGQRADRRFGIKKDRKKNIQIIYS